MASLYFRGERAEIQFTDANRKRRTLRLGRMNQRAAQRILERVKAINAARIASDTVDEDTAKWISKLTPAIADKLAAVDLLATPADVTIADMIDRYIASRTDAKSSTVTVWK